MLDTHPASLAHQIDAAQYQNEQVAVSEAIRNAALSASERSAIAAHAARLVTEIRTMARPGMMEVFLAEYGLSTDEGIALMCLAEALLRVPDADTRDDLIEDKIAPSDWARHLGQSTSTLVNASTWALMLTGRVLDDGAAPGPVGHLRAAVKRLGEPVIRAAVTRAIKEMGRQFVLGETITDAMNRAEEIEAQGYSYSYDMLGEAALTDADASRYFDAYQRAIATIASACHSDDIRDNPGISIKLSALHPRYERAQAQSVLEELVPRVRALAQAAKAAGMGLNIDAEEADRCALSLEVIEAVLAYEALAGWDGFGVVVQAYTPRAGAVIDALYAIADRHDRRLMARLVKGAYWDTEIKRAQVLGMDGFPVFTRKAHTDINYIAQARKLLGYADRLYPQFATHNAHSVAAILHMAGDTPFEFQRLHGMGEALHDVVKSEAQTRCRIYAPVGRHRDLLAYLVRRLLENGANSSFVNQVVDEDVPAEVVGADPFLAVEQPEPSLRTGAALFLPERPNSKGHDLAHLPSFSALDAERAQFQAVQWRAMPILATTVAAGVSEPLRSPTRPDDIAGHVQWATTEDVDAAAKAATPWAASVQERSRILNAAADLYEAHASEFFALLCREAGKTLPDCVAELREAVDFLRYYAARNAGTAPLGTVLAISPWNFPLAIFTGQIAAALACGNAVLAKPAEQTPLIAARAVQLLHAAGVPKAALQLLPGDGAIGAALTKTGPDLVAFTGGTDTAKLIRQDLAENAKPGTPLLAETGGLNAMIVDSTALPEQAIKAVVESAFQSAGQRCSALRCLYVQEDIAESFIEMLKGAMDRLRLGDPWALSTDVGPVIDGDALNQIQVYIAQNQSNLLHQVPAPYVGHFCSPTLLKVPGIATMKREVFGPVLHLTTFAAEALDDVIEEINGTGYGLTFGLHTRIDARVQRVNDRIHAGNLYINRNQIGAIVGNQPFGGHGLSGTGPKAGGPDYLTRFSQPIEEAVGQSEDILPGPTGESNRLRRMPRPALLCLGPDEEQAQAQKHAVEALGGKAMIANDLPPPDAPPPGGVLFWGDAARARTLDCALAERDGPIVPLITGAPDRAHVLQEQHICIDTTASGGNAQLLAEVSDNVVTPSWPRDAAFME